MTNVERYEQRVLEQADNWDYIIIPASAAIVATVIIAVIIFIACLKTTQKKRDKKVRFLD